MWACPFVALSMLLRTTFAMSSPDTLASIPYSNAPHETVELWLDRNSLTGTIPPSIGELTNLGELPLVCVVYRVFISALVDILTTLASLWNSYVVVAQQLHDGYHSDWYSQSD